MTSMVIRPRPARPGPALRRLRAAAPVATALLSMLGALLATGWSSGRFVGIPYVSGTREEALAALGRDLFRDPGLSTGGKVSCASCHDPARSFTDDRVRSRGQGCSPYHNTATLLGLADIAAFPHPADAEAAQERSQTLAERCLAPMRSKDEMGDDLPGIVQRLGDRSALASRFEDAFRSDGGPAVTTTRLGLVLAAFVRNLEPPPSPYSRFLAGKREALPEAARRGIEVFQGPGRCAFCHAGQPLNDGGLWLVRLPERGSAPIGGNLQTVCGTCCQVDPRSLRDTCGLVISQTLSLWDVSRTGPWFRDGSARSFDQAVRRHLRDLRTIGAAVEEAAAGATDVPLIDERAAARLPGMFPDLPWKIPASLVHQFTTDAWIPEAIPETSIQDLFAFLNTLSPAAPATKSW